MNIMVAIVLVNYNGADDTIECVRSLQNLDYKDYKIIIVDNKSCDDSIQKLQSLSKEKNIILLQTENNKGFSAGNNIGIRYALSQLNSDYVWLLNNDTIVSHNSLSELLKGFENIKDVGITTAKTYYWKNKKMIWYAGGSISRKTARTEHWHYNEIELNDKQNKGNNIPVSFASGCCMLIKREVFEKVGNLDETYFLYEEDADYCLRIAAAGYTIIYRPSAVIYHKVNASTGKAPGTVQYYSIRNKLWLIQKNYKGKNKIIALLYANLQMWTRCLKRELEWKYYRKAVLAYKHGEIGRKEIQN